MKIKKAVIPAAGYGTRLLPASKALPKEMLPIVDRPTIQYVIEEAIEAGIEEILVITSKDKESIEETDLIEAVDRHFIDGVGKYQDRLIILLNLEEVIGLSEECA